MPSKRRPREQGATPRQPPIRKSLGQHFLRDQNILRRIVEALELAGTETVVEIGPGRGALSDLLLPISKRLVLVEYDRALAALLKDRYAGHRSVTVVSADILSLNLSDLAEGGAFMLIGNLPYYLTTPILFHALARPRAERAVFLVQREVADRIVAAPDTSAYGALSVNVQALTRPTLAFGVKAGAFHPPPKVDSAVIRLDAMPTPLLAPEEEPAFSRLVQNAFSLRRKQLRRVLRVLLDRSPDDISELLSRLGFDPAARPETLRPQDFVQLFRAAREGITRDSPARS